MKGHNTGTIGVCLSGGHGSAETDKFQDNYTIAQDVALRDLIDELKRDYPHIQKISGHNEYAAKGCPGFQVNEWLVSGPTAPPATEIPSQGVFAAIVAAILGIFGGKK